MLFLQGIDWLSRKIIILEEKIFRAVSNILQTPHHNFALVKVKSK